MNLGIEHNFSSISVIILAGGNATRMGFPKPWLLKGNTTFLKEIVDSYLRFGIENIIVILNEKFATPEWENELGEVNGNASIIKNHFPEKGRLHSIYLGLKEVKSDYIFIHNCDNPFVEDEVLNKLTSNINKGAILIPTFTDKGGHPVVINKLVRKEILNNYQHYNTLNEVFSNFSKKRVKVRSNSILKNINTPQELEAYKYELA